MNKTAKDYEDTYTDPQLREKLKKEIMSGSRGGKEGVWSARKAQLLNSEYEKAGGKYKNPGKETAEQKSLHEWSKKH